ncbi:hypothetical protein F4808DRAFT_332585 [Astrocystis sublimbata]|nr:hypothetical protein F4808DRAFT_332585 [Astrocystis sublimbata]
MRIILGGARGVMTSPPERLSLSRWLRAAFWPSRLGLARLDHRYVLCTLVLVCMYLLASRFDINHKQPFQDLSTTSASSSSFATLDKYLTPVAHLIARFHKRRRWPPRSAPILQGAWYWAFSAVKRHSGWQGCLATRGGNAAAAWLRPHSDIPSHRNWRTPPSHPSTYRCMDLSPERLPT